MKIIWTRGSEKIRCDRPHTFFNLGVRGSGKSALLEHIGEGYLREDHVILDLFGSRDGEGLAWLRSQWVENKKVLLIHGDNTSVQGSFETRSISKLSLNDLQNYDILISSSPLYSSMDDEFFHVNRVIDLLYARISWRRLIYVLLREASNLLYSRLKVSNNQLAAKAEFIYLVREARHVGVALGCDSQKFTSVDLDVRSVLDYLILKSQGVLGLPRDQAWLYGYFAPEVLRDMPARNFFIVCRRGPLGIGSFPCPPWHKQERENILRSVGLKVEHGDRIEYGQNRGAFKTVGDQEHLQIVDTYFEGVSMGKIAVKLDRSAATVHAQVHAHNESIDKTGYCQECRRLKGKHEMQKTDARTLSPRPSQTAGTP